ncbi:MAG: patatin-like phospholipase family protein [bacterium]
MTRHLRKILFVLPFVLVPALQAQPRVAVALSGGGARGFAHLGVLRAFEEEKLPLNLIVGTSMGAVIGGLYASGYSLDEVEQIARSVDWSDIFLDRPSRRNLFLAQKETNARHILAVRFRGWAPEVPKSLTTGQKLNDLLFHLLITAPVRPVSSFDDLYVPFRAVATDLVTGQRIIFRQGDLCEALRASISMPLVFAPFRMDSLELVDGGVVENIPVKAARDEGADFVIAVDATTPVVPEEPAQQPWELADRVTSIMHIEENAALVESADFTLIPALAGCRSADFDQIDSMIRAGYEAAKQAMPLLLARLRMAGVFAEDTAGKQDRTAGLDTLISLEEALDFLVRNSQGRLATNPAHSSITQIANGPTIRTVNFEGRTLWPDSTLRRFFAPLLGKAPDMKAGLEACRNLVSFYRRQGYRLMRITRITLDGSGAMTVTLDEGRLRSIEVQGLKRNRPWTVLREFPLRAGDRFTLRRAERGIAQIYGTNLFESVFLSLLPSGQSTRAILRVRERESPQLRLGGGFSSERKGRGFAEFLNDNVGGLGARLSLFGKYGELDEELRTRLVFDRIFKTYLTTELEASWRREEYNFFNRQHDKEGFYFFERTGADLWLGQQFWRWGQLAGGFAFEKIEAGGVPDEPETQLASVCARSLIDTEDKYPFPTRGIKFSGIYSVLIPEWSDDWACNRLDILADLNHPFLKRTVFHSAGYYQWNDRRLPLWGHYRLGGRESLLGLHEAELNGNVKLSGLFEIRYDLISRLIADAYVSFLYTVGAVSDRSDPFPDAGAYLHGVGMSLSLSTFLGPVSFTYGHLLPSHQGEDQPRFYINLGHKF